MSLVNHYSYYLNDKPVVTLLTGCLQRIIRDADQILVFKKSRARDDMIVSLTVIVMLVFGCFFGAFWMYLGGVDWIMLLPVFLFLINGALDAAHINSMIR